MKTTGATSASLLAIQCLLTHRSPQNCGDTTTICLSRKKSRHNNCYLPLRDGQERPLVANGLYHGNSELIRVCSPRTIRVTLSARSSADC